MTTYGLTDLGYKIFLDRYALKDLSRESLREGDTVIAVVGEGQREIAIVKKIYDQTVVVETQQEEVFSLPVGRVDKPLELDPAQMQQRVARGVAAAEKTPEAQQLWQEKFEWLLKDFKFVPGGRILTAMGSGHELTSMNCFVVSSPHDSREGIIKTLGEMTELMSRGGGVGINISSLRPHNAFVKGVNGRSSGSVSFGGLYSYMTGLISQSGSRRGALLLMLNDWHPDVFDYAQSKKTAGKITNANISVGISDKFMEKVKEDGTWELVFPDTQHPAYDVEWDGILEKWQEKGYPVIVHRTVKARELWNTIIESAWASAEPGLWFRDRANQMWNGHYYSTLISTNPCVTGDTRIYTDQGLIQAHELFDKETDVKVVVDGRFGVSETTVPSTRIFMTGKKTVFRLQTKEGYYIRATADHRIMTPSGWVKLGNLQIGDKIHILNRKGGFGQEGSLELGRVLGWLVGDGTFDNTTTGKGGAILDFYHEKQQLADMYVGYINEIVQGETLTSATRSVYPVGALTINERKLKRIKSTRLKRVVERYGLVDNKLSVPEVVFKGTEDMQRGFLQSLFSADGGMQGNREKGTSVRLSSVSLDLLQQVQMLLLNFGISSVIYQERRLEGYRPMPDGQGGYKEYFSQSCHEIVIARRNINTFRDEIGFILDRKNESLEVYLSQAKRKPNETHFTATVKSIEPDGVEPVYDLTESITHSFVGNGIVLHNCGEISLSANAVCNLGAINLAVCFDENTGDVDIELLKQITQMATRFLDDVIDVSFYPTEAIKTHQLNERRVGLGIMGLADLLIKCKTRYGSQEGTALVDKIFKTIATEAYAASCQLAVEKGAFPLFDADELLKSLYMDHMPEDIQKSVRQNGIRNVNLLTAAPTGTISTMVNVSGGIEPFFSFSYFRKSRLGTSEVRVPLVEQYMQNNGLTSMDELPNWFVTAMELSPEEHVRIQAAAQRWVDSSISKTVNVPNDYTVEQVANLYRLLYESGCKGGTIYRDGSRDEQVLYLDKPQTQAASFNVETRKQKLSGVTVQRKSPFGSIFVTINEDESKNPFEVFINVGKAGTDLQADAEALGRMISLLLRSIPSDQRRVALRQALMQIEGIGGREAWGLGKQRSLSIPDAVASALGDYLYDVHSEPHADYAPLDLLSKQPVPALHNADLCPDCHSYTVVRSEGCSTCQTCGWSKC